ncbi:ZP domain-containing protein [Trichonephila clavipes]|nr:ZP domain-containing protein [Trichonephila clavipes]
MLEMPDQESRSHQTRDCQIKKLDTPFCVNCQVHGHMANYSKCPLFPKPRKGANINSNPILTNNFIRPNISYAQVTQKTNHSDTTHQMAPLVTAPIDTPTIKEIPTPTIVPTQIPNTQTDCLNLITQTLQQTIHALTTLVQHISLITSPQTVTAQPTPGPTKITSKSPLTKSQIIAQINNLLNHYDGPKSILSIPKAILRKAGSKGWRTEPTVHQLQSRSDSAATTSVKRLEMEDQTVTTMLESENHIDEDTYWTLRDGSSRQLVQQDKIQTSATSGSKETAPVYAQVDKNKKISTTISQQQKSMKSTETSTRPSGTSVVPGYAKRQMVTETPEERKTSEEVTKNTTVTTSVRREVKETRILSPSLDKFRQEISDELDSNRGGRLDSSPDLPTIQENSEESSSPEPTTQGLAVGKTPKSILIRDVSDIYLTTTVETELRELTTKVSRDIEEQHAKATEEPAGTSKKIAVSKPPPKTNNWNVVIRQREPYIPTMETDLDASVESNGESTDEPESVAKPHFDVKIRTIPPEQLKPKKSDQMISIPPLEMPDAVTKLKEVLTPKTGNEQALYSEPPVERKKETAEEIKDKPRTVRWLDDTKEPNPEEGSTVSSSDSFQSAASLRERSSSEVLEVAPTLPSQTRAPRRPPPMLERSTSEIPSPEDNVRWVGGVVPVLESLSPEFLANIPVVIQGGFFNRQRPPTPPSKNNDSA